MSWNFFAIEIHIPVRVYFEGFLSNENNFRRNKFLSYFLSAVVLRAVSISSSRWSWGWAISFSSNSFRCFPLSQPGPVAAGGEGVNYPGVYRVEDKRFSFRSTWEDEKKKSKWKSQIPRCDGVCGSYFHISADILLNLFTAQRKFNFGIAMCAPAWAVGWVRRCVERERRWSDSDFEGWAYRLFYIHKINSFYIIRFYYIMAT